MQPYVSREVMDQTWRRIGASSGKSITKLQKRHFKEQKPLCLFIAKHLDFYREEAAGVFLYVAHAMLEAALTCNPKPRRVSASSILAVEEELMADDLPDYEFHLTNYAYEAFSDLDTDDVVLEPHEIETMLNSINVVTMCIHIGFSQANK